MKKNSILNKMFNYTHLYVIIFLSLNREQHL